MIFHTINYIYDGIGILHIGAFKHQISCWHCLGNFTPTAKCKTLTLRCFGHFDNTAILQCILCKHFTFQYKRHSIAVHSKRTTDCDVPCRHRGRNLTPTAEGVTLLHRRLRDGNCSTINETLGLVYLTVHHIGHSVGVHGEATIDCNVLGWHGSGNTAPATEGMALLDRFCHSSHLAAVSYVLRLVNLTVHHISDGIAIHSKRTTDGDVPCRHRGRNLTPTAEGVTLLHRRLRDGNCSTINETLGLVYLTVHHIGHSVGVHGEATIDCNVLGWHGSGNTAPATESMALLDRCCYSRDCATIENLLGPILHSIHHVYNAVYIGSKLCRETYILRSLKNIGVRSTPVRPTREMKTFIRRSRQHHRCIGIKDTSTSSSTTLSRIYDNFIASRDGQHSINCCTLRWCNGIHCQTYIAKRYREITDGSILHSR